jgi:hypothetical protein
LSCSSEIRNSPRSEKPFVLEDATNQRQQKQKNKKATIIKKHNNNINKTQPHTKQQQTLLNVYLSIRRRFVEGIEPSELTEASSSLSLSMKSSSSFSSKNISFADLFLLRNRVLLSIHNRITSTLVKAFTISKISTNTSYFIIKNELKEQFDFVYVFVFVFVFVCVCVCVCKNITFDVQNVTLQLHHCRFFLDHHQNLLHIFLLNSDSH